jgi:UDP-N-acetyl-D-mannosaminuronic acid dehydrogenase
METVVVVGGGGHVGLPLALVLADCGYKVTSLDISTETVELINSGTMPFFEEDAQLLLNKCIQSKFFSATTDYGVISAADIVIVVIGTPVDEYLNPNPKAVLDVFAACKPFMNSNQLAILRSTVFPGVTARVQELLRDSGLATEVVFCPERILEGKALKELRELPQIIGASTERGAIRSIKLFKSLGIKTITVSPEEAELAKLFTNVWRYIKFAAANQFWIMSNEAGLDFSRIREAVTFDYPRASDLPTAGFAAGPCLLKDTMQLAAFSDNNFALGHSAMLVNEGLPLYLVSKIEGQYDLRNLKVGILGMAFKGGSDDIRSSLAYKLRKILDFKAAQTFASDPFVTVDSSLISEDELLTRADIIIIGAPHSQYKTLVTNKPIFDIWNITGKGNLV